MRSGVLLISKFGSAPCFTAAGELGQMSMLNAEQHLLYSTRMELPKGQVETFMLLINTLI